MTAEAPAGQHPAMSLVETSTDDPGSVELIAELQQIYAQLYGGPDETPMAAAQFAPPNGSFLLARDPEGHPIGCVGVRRHEARIGEIKRMYVRPEHRRLGYARALLAAAEDRARDLGYSEIVLETGAAQPEAIAFYHAHGYRPVPGFGHYRCAPLSRSFRREL